MRKAVIVFLTLVLVISVLAIPAIADDGGAVVKVTVSPTGNVHPGTQITYTISVSNNSQKAIVGLNFEFKLPAGLTNATAQKSSDGGFQGDFSLTPPVGDNSTVTLHSGNQTKSEFTIGTITATVPNTMALGSQSFSIIAGKLVISDSNGDPISATSDVSGATFTVVHDKDSTSEIEHAWDEGTVTKATCKEPMSTHYTCTTCQATKDVPEGDALGHDFGGTTFNWDGTTADMASVTVTVKCAHEGCVYHNNTAPSQVELTTSHELKPGSTCGKAGKVIWTAKGTVDGVEISDTYEVDTDTVMHNWNKPNVKWSLTGDTKSAEASRTCNNCGQTETATATPTKDEAKSTAPTCTQKGKEVYTATFDFSNTNNAQYTQDDQKTVTVESDPVPVDALGHEWPKKVEFTWTGESDKVEGATATAKVKCQRDNCDAEDFKTEKEYTAEITKDVTEAPSCENGGSVTYTATLDNSKLPGLKTPYTEDKVEKLGALGHDFGENNSNKAEFTWPEKAGDKNTEEPKDVTATLYCEREKENITADSVDVVAGNKVAGGKTEPTYEKDGTYYWTATATFSDGKNGTVEKTEANHGYTVPKLEATVEASELPSQADQSAKAKDALEADVKAMLDAALTENSFSGMDEDLKEALQNAQVSTTAGMNVTTELVVDSASGTVTGVDAENVKGYYDIHIDVTVQLGSDTKIGHITEVSTPITFTIKLPEGGPIWYVMTDHSGTWAKIDGSKVENDSIVFSSKQFSNFAIISSNDLKDAKIEAIPAQTYTGKAITPKVKVTINGGQELTENVDYTVTYSNNTDKGTAKVTIEAVEGSDYTGSNTADFQIKAASSGGSGSGSGNGSGSGSPETGDETPLALYAAVLTASLAALAAILLVLRKQRQK